MQTVDEFEIDGLTVKIHPDDDPMNPRKEFDHVGTMVCWHRRYDLGDDHDYSTPRDFQIALAREIHPDLDEDKADIGAILAKHYVMLPLGLYDHSGITMYIGSGANPFDPGGWDSGQVGYIYCTAEQIKAEWNGDREAAIRYLKGEVEEYDQYLTGQVYGYTVEDENGDDLDSCWGFFGEKYCREEATSSAKHLAKERAEETRKAEEQERHAQEWEPRMMAL